MKTELPKRFTDAVTKLYNAFHSGKLYALDCTACAVGNILDNREGWEKFFSFGRVYNRDIPFWIEQTGYSAEELAEVEIRFIEFCSVKDYMDGNYNCVPDLNYASKNIQFKGLCAVIEYLCELDNIPNIMEYKSLFETENKRELTEVLS